MNVQVHNTLISEAVASEVTAGQYIARMSFLNIHGMHDGDLSLFVPQVGVEELADALIRLGGELRRVAGLVDPTEDREEDAPPF